MDYFCINIIIIDVAVMKNIIKVWNDNPTEDQIDNVIKVLKDGGLAIIPTDTLYGLVCDALNSKAIEKLCRVKGLNPDKSNLSIICSDLSMASSYSKINNEAFRIIKENTPGPFTFLLKSSSQLPKAFKGRKTVGIRIPDCLTARMVAEQLGNPIMTTSIDFETDDFARNVELISENYDGIVDVIIEGEEGMTEYSTIVDLTTDEPTIIREGKGELQ